MADLDVTISGAVCSPGHHLFRKAATIRSALEAAGGLAAETAQMRASGFITVRRPKAHRKVRVWRFNMTDAIKDWETFELETGDLVIFRWKVEFKSN
jgi:protein involved in polysaccharide export with SLBB domain